MFVKRSFVGRFGLFKFPEFLFVSLFFGDGGVVGSMGVISLVNGDEGQVNGVVHGEGGGENEDLPHPRVLLEDSGEQSPASLGSGAGVECRYDLGGSFWNVRQKVLKVGLTVWE